VLSGYRYVNDINDSIINNYNGKFGWYDEELGASGRTNRRKWDQDKAALMEIMPDLQFLSSNLGRGVVEDELIRGVGAMMNESPGNTPLSLAWAAQIYLDILQNMGKDCEMGYKEMQVENLKIKKAMLNLPASCQERNRVLGVATKWDTDPIYKFQQQMITLGLLPPPGTPSFKFLRRNPMYCGLWIHSMRTSFHYNGVHYAAAPGDVMVTTQLYHALRQEKCLPDGLVWKDLEKFWAMQGNATFFVGNPPTNRESYFKNYCLSLGVSATNWASNKRRGKVNLNNANRLNMKFNGWVSLNMGNRLIPTGEREPLSSDLIEGILDAGHRHTYLDGKGHVKPDMKDKAREAKASYRNKIITDSDNTY
jgi:hypothetical protein